MILVHLHMWNRAFIHVPCRLKPRLLLGLASYSKFSLSFWLKNAHPAQEMPEHVIAYS